MTYISVILPTRERSDTLQSALKTVCEQDYPDMEILVSDNVSEDDTAAVVARFNDPRIRYIRTPQRLSMTGNYCFALGHARGTYVTILGDDDGFVPGALSVLARWARATGADAISWQQGTYFWPTYSLPDRRNQLQIPVLDLNWNVSAAAAFTAAKWGFLRWTYMPIIYGGLVKLDVMNRLRERTGEYLLSHFPDVYSAIALCTIIKHYIYTEHPISVFGYSGKSMASVYSSSRITGEASAADTFGVFLKENTTELHPDFPVGDLRLESAAILDCLYRVKDALFGGRLFVPDTIWLYRLLRETNHISEPLRSEMLSRLNSIARQRRRRWPAHLLLLLSSIKSAAEQTHPYSISKQIEEANLKIDATKFDVADIYSACNLVAKLRPLPTDVPTFSDAGLWDFLKLRRTKQRLTW
jgi:glycosyltransferase involved in cell wall biosynthesis